MSRDMLAELRQNKPFPHPEEELYLSLLRTADLLGREFTDALKEQKLSLAQYNVLRILRGAEPDGLPCGEIASRMVTRDPDVTRLLDRLAQRNFIERGRGPADRRVVSARITAAGMELLHALDQPVTDIHKKQLGFLSPPEIQEVLRQLTRIREHLS